METTNTLKSVDLDTVLNITNCVINNIIKTSNKAIGWKNDVQPSSRVPNSW